MISLDDAVGVEGEFSYTVVADFRYCLADVREFIQNTGFINKFLCNFFGIVKGVVGDIFENVP